jgi:transcriptional regulator with XRE-family HTH domain
MLRGVKAPNERTDTANLLVALRKARGFTSGKAAAAHVRDQTGVADSVWAQYESGTRKISDKHRAAIESVLGALGDAPAPASASALTPDVAALVGSINGLLEELRAERQERASLAETVNELRGQIREMAAALREGGAGGAPPATPSQGGQGAPPRGDKEPRSHAPAGDR